MSDIQEQLDYAYDLIQDDQEDAALDVLRPIVQADPQNADAWWLISYATDDPREARRALVTTLKLDPDHSKAREMLEQLNQIAPPEPDEEILLKELTASDHPSSAKADKASKGKPKKVADADDDEDFFADILEEAESIEKAEDGGFSTPIQILLGAVVVVMAIFLGVALLNEEKADDGSKGEADLAALRANESDALAGMELGADRSAIFSDTDLGNTLFVETCVCISPECVGPRPQELPNLVLESVRAATAEVVTASATDEVQAVGVNVVACQSDDTVYRGFAPIEAVQDYENLDYATLTANWTTEG